MKKTAAIVFFVTLIFVSGPVFSAKDYLYRQRASWVKLAKLSSKQMAGQELSHPCQGISSEQMAFMLKSITIHKGKLIKTEKDTIGVFSDEEAAKYAPLLVQALGQATANQIVNFAVVHKRPYFILRNDYISVANVFVQGNELHLNFTKIYAKLKGDYKQASRLDRAVSNAKSIRLALVAMPGQILTKDGYEIIMDLNHDFGGDVSLASDEQTRPIKGQEPVNVEKESTEEKTAQVGEIETVIAQEGAFVTPEEDTVTRLKKLEQLKKEKLVTEAEYQEKKFKILDEL